MDIQEEVIEKVLELASRQFRLQNFQECLVLFSRAISYAHSLDQNTIIKARRHYGLTERPQYAAPKDNLHHPKLVTLLDNRAATLEKLHRLRDALEDAREMRRVEPYNARGYIRCTKLLARIHGSEKAYECAVQGITMLEEGREKYKMKANPKFVQILVDMKREFRPKQKQKRQISTVVPIPEAPTTTKKQRMVHFDPLIHLPVELITHILLLVPLKQRVRCLQVSKAWNEVISGLPLYNTITMASHTGSKDVLNCFKLISKSKSHVPSSSPAIRKLSIPSMRITDERQILNFIMNRNSIQIMDLLDLKIMDISLKEMVEIIRNSPNARNSILSRLKHIKISCLLIPTFEEILLSLLPHLHTITLISSRYNLQKQALSKNYIPSRSIYSNLTSLSLIGDLKHKYPSIPFHNLFTIHASTQLPNLSHLMIIGFDFQLLNSVNGNYNFLLNFPQLHTLILENNKSFTFRTLLKNHDSLQLPKLTKFVFREHEIKYIEGLQLYDSIYLANCFQSLRSLDLTNSTISTFGLFKVLELCGVHLRNLSIGSCPNITFQTSHFQSNTTFIFKFDQFIKFCPILEQLYLNESDLSDFALTQFINAITKTKGLRLLKVLDLSFNLDLSGFKILEFVRIRPLKLLFLHGMSIKAETIKFIQKESLAARVESKLDKQYWREYGINSYNPF